MTNGNQLDLGVVAADKQIKAALDTLLGARHAAFGIRPVTFEVLNHPRNDPGCLNEGPELLVDAGGAERFSKALLVFDREGSGLEAVDAADAKRDLTQRLQVMGWQNSSGVVLIEPELEAWVWSDSPHVDEILGWQGQTPSLRGWLQQMGFDCDDAGKPRRPKEAFLAAIREARVPRSSSLYKHLAERVSLTRCTDQSFITLKDTLQEWFPAHNP